MLAIERARSYAIRGLRGVQLARPPRAARGLVVAPPDFVGVGAAKSGTSWWHSLIQAHPGVTSRSKPKELHYFDRYRPWRGTYEQWFPRRAGTLCGEWTPQYMTERRFLSALRAAAPDARILVLLRDPVDRYIAWFTLRVRQHAGRASTYRTLAFQRGLYATQLGHVFDLFERDRVLVLQYESCVQDPTEQLNRTYAFLGLDAFVPPAALLERGFNRARVPKIELTVEERTELVDLYEPEVARLRELVPDVRMELWPSFRHLVG